MSTDARATSTLTSVARAAAPGRATRVLYADDDERQRALFVRVASPIYDVTTVPSGDEAFVLLDKSFSVVVSDLEMPGMDGIAFLTKARAKSPDTVRILLTGAADLPTAIAAVNEGNVFRFLTKPCPNALLLSTLFAANEQHRLITAERVLLRETLTGSIIALAGVLAMANPTAYGRALRAKNRVNELKPFLPASDGWMLEVAALLCQTGAASLRDDTAKKIYLDEPLSAQEKRAALRAITLSADMMANIPRLEHVADAVRYQAKRFDGTGDPVDGLAGEAIPFGGRVLKVVLDLDTLESRERSLANAVETMRKRQGFYDPAVLDAVDGLARSVAVEEICEIPLHEVRAGMIFADDLLSPAGALLAGRGLEVTASLEDRIANSWEHLKNCPVRVVIRSGRRA